MKHPVDKVPAWGSFFKSEERLGKRMQKGGAKAGGKPFQSIPRKAFCWDHRVALRPPYIMAPANHRPPSFSLLKKDPHAGTCAIFKELKCYQEHNPCHMMMSLDSGASVTCDILGAFKRQGMDESGIAFCKGRRDSFP